MVVFKNLSPPCPTEPDKQPSTHHSVRVHDSIHGFLAVVPAGSFWPPQLGPGGPNALESRLNQLRDLFQSLAVKFWYAWFNLSLLALILSIRSSFVVAT
jgi:hypothetical protein